MDGTEIIVTEQEKLKQLALSDLARAKDLKVTDNESYRDCCMMELQLKQNIKEVTDKLEPVVTSTRVAWKAALQLLSDAVDPRSIALKYVQDQRTGYERKQKAIAEEQQRVRQQEATEKSKKETEQLADILEQSNEPELAAQVRENFTAPTVPVEVDVPKIKGIATREKWFFKIIDENKILRVYMTPNQGKIQGLVNSQGKDAEKIVGGIEVWSQEVPWGAAKIK